MRTRSHNINTNKEQSLHSSISISFLVQYVHTLFIPSPYVIQQNQKCVIMCTYIVQGTHSTHAWPRVQSTTDGVAHSFSPHNAQHYKYTHHASMLLLESSNNSSAMGYVHVCVLTLWIMKLREKTTTSVKITTTYTVGLPLC